MGSLQLLIQILEAMESWSAYYLVVEEASNDDHSWEIHLKVG